MRKILCAGVCAFSFLGACDASTPLTGGDDTDAPENTGNDGEVDDAGTSTERTDAASAPVVVDASLVPSNEPDGGPPIEDPEPVEVMPIWTPFKGVLYFSVNLAPNPDGFRCVELTTTFPGALLSSEYTGDTRRWAADLNDDGYHEWAPYLSYADRTVPSGTYTFSFRTVNCPDYVMEEGKEWPEPVFGPEPDFGAKLHGTSTLSRSFFDCERISCRDPGVCTLAVTVSDDGTLSGAGDMDGATDCD